ncbi:MAG: hypothetical protein IKG14_04055 [Clostridia bacterium]|nr:hypothetical protein [Clostridia bacterium]
MDNNGGLQDTLNLLQSYKMDSKAQSIQEGFNPKEKKNKFGYPDELSDTKLERIYIGLLLNEIKAISVYYFTFDDCYFVDEMLLNIYKKILFTDGEKYAPKIAKEKFNFSKESQELYEIKNALRDEFIDSKYRLEDIYMKLKKIFILRKNYLGIPVKEIQAKIADILNYELYAQMTPEDVESAVEQVTLTEKFKRAVLNKNLTKFLVEGDNTLTNGLDLPFPILTKAFKGIRIGETASFSMPSNYGKSRFTINLAAYLAIVHEKKVLIISNEMSEEKMKLCLITTILNNPIIQKIHKQKVHVSENQLLEFKFRPDNNNLAEVDEQGFIVQNEGESHYDFANRLAQVSSEFRNVIRVTNWFNEKLYNSIHFIDITDHTNEELKKVIMNYYYKEQVHYVFYDTLKTDIENIGNGEELKKTATILSNLAQNYGMYIGSTLQLSETATDPVNLSVADMAVSRTVKEVLDTLCLFKQIRNEDLIRYEYSIDENFSETKEIERFADPDVRYYSCVIDKNRAGPKPVLLFKINLAYNSWEELGYLRLK